MKPIKKTTATALSKVPVSAVSVLKKIKPQFTVNLPVAKGTDLNDSEISIKVGGRQITVSFFQKGELVSQQAIPVKKIPNPPPWPKDDIIKILEQLRLNFSIQR